MTNRLAPVTAQAVKLADVCIAWGVAPTGTNGHHSLRRRIEQRDGVLRLGTELGAVPAGVHGHAEGPLLDGDRGGDGEALAI